MHIRGRTLTSKRSNTLRFGHARLRESVRTLHVFSVVHFAPISVSLLLRRISGATQTLREQSGREWRSLHIEAQLRNDLVIRKILPTALSLTENTFRRWLKRLAEEAVLKLEKQEGDCAVSAPPPPGRARKGAPKAESAQVHGQLGGAQSSLAGVLGDACRGPQLERNGSLHLCRRDAAVAHSQRKWGDRLDAKKDIIRQNATLFQGQSANRAMFA